MTPNTVNTNRAALLAIARCALAAAVAPLPASAFGGTYVAECHLSDGSKFVLRAKYERSIFGVGHSAGVSPSDWEVFHQPKGKARETRAPVTLPFTGQHTPECSKLGLINGRPAVFFSFLDKNGKWFAPDRIPGNVQRAASYDEPGVKERLQQQQLASLYREAFVAPVGSDIVYEAPLLTFPQGDQDGIVSAVMQSISRDGGTSWSPPAISRKTFIYELGRSTLSQGFVAKRGVVKPGS